MPELPEVEVVRLGVDRWVRGRSIERAEVLHPRAIRRHEPGERDFSARIAGNQVVEVGRRGKYMWLAMESREAVVIHLGMSGQLLVQPETNEDEKHLRVRFDLATGGKQLRFVDQRTFGGLLVDDLVDGAPSSIQHIARDPFDSEFDAAAVARAMVAKTSQIKRVLLDQTVVSGIGNIYADEALWRAGIAWSMPACELSEDQVALLLTHSGDVMREALASGGTSFDDLYVNVNGASGYFDRSLNAYGQAGKPCNRCGAPIVRESFMNRSSFRCGICQPAPTD